MPGRDVLGVVEEVLRQRLAQPAHNERARSTMSLMTEPHAATGLTLQMGYRIRRCLPTAPTLSPRSARIGGQAGIGHSGSSSDAKRSSNPPTAEADGLRCRSHRGQPVRRRRSPARRTGVRTGERRRIDYIVRLVRAVGFRRGRRAGVVCWRTTHTSATCSWRRVCRRYCRTGRDGRRAATRTASGTCCSPERNDRFNGTVAGVCMSGTG